MDVEGIVLPKSVMKIVNLWA